MTKHVTLVYPQYNKKAKVARVEYPDNGLLHWDVNQQTLQIKAPDGLPLAVFARPSQVLVDDQVTVEWSTAENESPSPS